MNWKGLKLLNQLFEEGTTSSNLMKFSYAKRLYSMEYFVQEKKTLTKTNRFDSYYLRKHQEQFNSFDDLISRYDLEETNFALEELEALLKLSVNKEHIVEKGLSPKEISTLYFDDAKRLKKGTKLFDTVLKVLELDTIERDEHDQQFLFVLHCKKKTPTAIILCENVNLLKKPRLDSVELWFAGGRNTAKLKFVIEPTIPFFYLCDWDNKGMEIYQDIKRNIFNNIQLLFPEKPLKFLSIEPKWPEKKWKTTIDPSLFSNEAKQLLSKLIPEKWIEEESFNHNLLS
jgi:hypothetical protein